MHELVVGPAGSGKTRRCVERCLAALAGRRPVLYLVPNRDEELQLHRRLLDAVPAEGLFLPGVERFQGLVRRILDRAAPGWEPRDPLARRLHVERLLRAADAGALGAGARTAGFAVLLDRLLAELDDGGVAPADLAALAGRLPRPRDRERVAALARLQAALRDEAEPALDAGAALRRACEILEAEPGQLTGEDGARPVLVVDGFSNLTPLQVRLLDALVAAADEACLALCLDPADLDAGEPRPPFERLRTLARRYAGRPDWRVTRLGAPRRYAAPVLAGLAARLFRADGAGGLDAGDGLQELVGATPRDEAEGVARELRLALAAGTPPSRVAVLARDDRMVDLLAGILEREGIPFHARRDVPLARLPLADLALTLLDWAADLGPVTDLPRRLRGGYTDLDDAVLAGLQRAARERGAPLGVDWDAFLDEARAARGGSARDGAAPPDGRAPGDAGAGDGSAGDAAWAWLDWRRDMPDSELDGAAWRREVLDPLLTLLRRRLLRRGAAALARSEFAAAPLRELRLDLPALEHLAEAGHLLAEAGLPGGRAAPLAAWVRALRRAVEACRVPERLGCEGGGVALGNPLAVRLPELDLVFVCGLNEGRFPPPVREHPLLRESERELLAEAWPRLATRRDRQAEERYLFYVAVTRAARRLVLCRAQRDEQGRQMAPSLFLLELRTLLARKAEPILSPPRSLPGKLRAPLGRRHLLQAVLLAGGGRERPALAGAAESFLAGRGDAPLLTAARRRRAEPELAGDPGLGPHLAARERFSPTQLEDYAACPYRWLASRLLNLEEAEAFAAGPREEGALYHATLERLWREARGDPAVLSDAEERRARLAAAFAAAREALASELPSLLSPRFAAEDERRLERLDALLARDLERLAATGARPEPDMLELDWALDASELPAAGGSGEVSTGAVGGGEGGATVGAHTDGAPGGGEGGATAGAGAGAPFALTGRVDRVDRLPNGEVLVLDLKRGDPGPDPVGAVPARFQLPLYALALAREERVAGSAFLSVAGCRLRGRFREDLKADLAPFAVQKPGQWLADEDWDAWLAAAAAGARGIVAAIRRGELEPAPRVGEDVCRFCPYPLLCRRPRRGKGVPGPDEGEEP